MYYKSTQSATSFSTPCLLRSLHLHFPQCSALRITSLFPTTQVQALWSPTCPYGRVVLFARHLLETTSKLEREASSQSGAAAGAPTARQRRRWRMRCKKRDRAPPPGASPCGGSQSVSQHLQSTGLLPRPLQLRKSACTTREACSHARQSVYLWSSHDSGHASHRHTPLGRGPSTMSRPPRTTAVRGGASFLRRRLPPESRPAQLPSAS